MGYKQTEVGVIPEDWEVKSLKDFAVVKGGKRLPIGKSVIEKVTSHPYLRVTDMLPGGIDLSDIKYVPEDVFPFIKNYCIGVGDIFISVAGTLGLVGKIPLALDGANLTENADKITSIASDQDFLLYNLMSDRIQGIIESEKTVGAQPKLAIARIENFAIALPPNRTEQRAIATALSDVDALLYKLDALIAKKRDLKQATMQQLLTGQTRLPGFSGEWEVKRLGDVADPSQNWSFTGGPFGSNLKSSDYTSQGVRIIQLQNIGDGVFHDDYAIYTSPSKANELISCNVYSGEIIMSKMGDPVARACLVPSFDARYLMCSDGIRLAADQKRFTTKFIYYQINGSEFRTSAENAGTGSTRKRIGLTQLRNLELKCPALSEQAAIATVLSDMDAELAALEARRDKTRSLKQGMMQELLTGRIRLV